MTTDTHAPWTRSVTHSETREDAHRADGPGRQAEWVAWFGDESHGDGTPADREDVAADARTPAVTVRPGFLVTPDAYLHALARVGGQGELRFRVASVDADDPAALTRAAKECQALVRSAGMPDAVRRAVLDAYARLGRDVPVMVHLSESTDDGAPSPLTGTPETFIDVRGVLRLIDSIVECWAAQWSPQAVAHRTSHGVMGEPVMAVTVQPIVNA